MIAHAVERLSHARTISHLKAGSGNPARWADVAVNSMYQLMRAWRNR
jgi:hypothetical protein